MVLLLLSIHHHTSSAPTPSSQQVLMKTHDSTNMAATLKPHVRCVHGGLRRVLCVFQLCANDSMLELYVELLTRVYVTLVLQCFGGVCRHLPVK